jgi:hypothetical protein
MHTRSRRSVRPLLVVMFGALVAGSCGDSPPTMPSAETSFLRGTWSGTLTITRTGEPDVSGAATFTFDVIPQSNRQRVNLSVQSSNNWMP